MKKKSGFLKTPPVSRASSSGELLLEVGSEELPFEFIAPALASLQDQAGRMLTEARLSFRSVRAYGTPRRLVLVVDGLAAVQAATTKEAMGPSKAVAYQNGQPTKAAIGFATSQGLAVEDLQIRQTPKGEYLFAVKREDGRRSTAVLTELLPTLVAKLSFPKSMKWNDAGVRFARPVRWVVALYQGVVLPIQVAGIRSGNRTSGHRVLGKGKHATVRDYASYESALNKLGVIVDQDKRRETIQRQLTQVSRKAGVELNLDERLLDQAV
ncbi:MAG TPA: glycine--tRNA ligase subunit beta, partial [Nitrospiraceae bacterium]